MAAKKKANKKTSAKKNRAVIGSKKKPSAKKKASVKKKLSVKKKPSPRTPAAKRVAKPVARAKSAPKTQIRTKRQKLDSGVSRTGRVRPVYGDADSQGLSEVERADSESVGELLDEGNAFEAGVVSGVEQADDADGREVRTREFPEDDVPEEYLDKD
jgi:hypothetical protein